MEITCLQLNCCHSVLNNNAYIKDTNQFGRQYGRIAPPCTRHSQDFLLGIEHKGTLRSPHTPVGLVTFCACAGMVPFAPKQLLVAGYQAPRSKISPSPDCGSTNRLTDEAFNPWRMWCIQKREEPMHQHNEDQIVCHLQEPAEPQATQKNNNAMTQTPS